MLWVELRKGEMLELEDGIDGLKAFMKAAKYEQNTEDYWAWDWERTEKEN